jgi:hypothetical protein
MEDEGQTALLGAFLELVHWFGDRSRSASQLEKFRITKAKIMI